MSRIKDSHLLAALMCEIGGDAMRNGAVQSPDCALTDEQHEDWGTLQHCSAYYIYILVSFAVGHSHWKESVQPPSYNVCSSYNTAITRWAMVMLHITKPVALVCLQVT